jgi:P4 family phage/plasmid primase-like protien
MENTTDEHTTEQAVTPDEVAAYIDSLPDITPVADKQRYAEGALALIAALPPLFHGMHTNSLAKKLCIPVGDLRSYLKRMAAIPRQAPRNAAISDDGFELTDSGNAKRLAQALQRNVRYAEAYAKFMVYQGGVWAYQESRSKVRALAAQMVAKQLKAAREAGNQDLVSYWRQCEGRRALDNMVELLIDQKGLKVDPTSLDRHPKLLNFTNCTLNLETRVPQEHNPDDLLTQQIPHPYDPDATCPYWERFLESSQPRADVRGWLHRYDGACLAEGNAEQYLVIHHGVGGGGKSTRRTAEDHALGPHYARKLHRSVFERGSPNAQPHPTNLMDAKSRRLVYGAEISPRLYLEQIKELTGRDIVKAHFMREDFEDLRPTWRTEIMMNAQPIVPEDPGGAFAQRLRIIPWTVQFRGTEREDRHLDAKLAAEAEGILAWMVRGYYLYADSGLPKVEAIEVATKKVLDANDKLQAFLDHCCEVADPKDTSVATEKLALWELRKAYNVERNHHLHEGQDTFESALEARGYVTSPQKHPKSRRVQWQGLRLRPVEPPSHERDSPGLCVDNDDDHAKPHYDETAEYAQLMADTGTPMAPRYITIVEPAAPLSAAHETWDDCTVVTMVRMPDGEEIALRACDGHIVDQSLPRFLRAHRWPPGHGIMMLEEDAERLVVTADGEPFTGSEWDDPGYWGGSTVMVLRASDGLYRLEQVAKKGDVTLDKLGEFRAQITAAMESPEREDWYCSVGVVVRLPDGTHKQCEGEGSADHASLPHYLWAIRPNDEPDGPPLIARSEQVTAEWADPGFYHGWATVELTSDGKYLLRSLSTSDGYELEDVGIAAPVVPEQVADSSACVLPKNRVRAPRSPAVPYV